MVAVGRAHDGNDGARAAIEAALARAAREGRALGPDDVRGIPLIGADLHGLDFTGADLAGVNLGTANLAHARLVRAQLKGAVLVEARLDDADLTGAFLDDAALMSAHAPRAGFGGASLTGADLVGADLTFATLSHAKLDGARLSGAKLDDARLQHASLKGVEAHQTSLHGADLVGADVDGGAFDRADLRGAHLKGLRGFERATFIGADIRDVDFCGAYLVRRHIVDENYLHEFRTRDRYHHALYLVWWATSDCGRSFLRWGLWTALVALLFAGAFHFVAVDPGDYPTFLSNLYFSVVILTTLGFGDVLPASTAAQLVVMVEVVIGYLLLGGLLGIFANKMGRRAD